MVIKSGLGQAFPDTAYKTTRSSSCSIESREGFAARRRRLSHFCAEKRLDSRSRICTAMLPGVFLEWPVSQNQQIGESDILGKGVNLGNCQSVRKPHSMSRNFSGNKTNTRAGMSLRDVCIVVIC